MVFDMIIMEYLWDIYGLYGLLWIIAMDCYYQWIMDGDNLEMVFDMTLWNIYGIMDDFGMGLLWILMDLILSWIL